MQLMIQYRTIFMSMVALGGCGEETGSRVSVDGGEPWRGQEIQGMPATCVIPEQVESMPDQARCPKPGGESAEMGMDLVWDFFSRYRRTRDSVR